jgi:hypothetical protein
VTRGTFFRGPKCWGLFLANAVLDLLFLVAWAWVHHVIDEQFFSEWRLRNRLDQFTINLLQIMFVISTLIPIAVFILADLVRSVRLIWTRAMRP